MLEKLIAAPGHNGVQQFLQQGQPNKANQSGFHRPTPNAAVVQTDTGGKHNTPVPSVEPAKMHDLTYALDDSFVLHRPVMQPNSQADTITGTAIPGGITPLLAKGDDGRLEIDLSRGPRRPTSESRHGGVSLSKLGIKRSEY